MWTIWHTGTDNLDIGFVEVSPGNEIHIRIGGIFTFFSSQTPVRMSGGYSATRTIGYAFYKMGN